MMRARRVYDYAAYHSMAALFLGVSFALNALCLIGLALPFRARLAAPLRRLLQRLFVAEAWLVGALGVLKLTTPPPCPAPPGTGRIWLMNHPSIFDGSYMLKFIANGTCIYKKAIGANPFYGAIARLADHLPNEGGPDLVRSAVRRLQRGEQLVIFPEGTRSTRLDLSKFKSGFALIAKRAQAPIYALWSDNPPDFLTRESSRWRAPALPARVTIRLLEVIEPRPGENADALMKRVAALYAGQLQQTPQPHDARAAISR